MSIVTDKRQHRQPQWSTVIITFIWLVIFHVINNGLQLSKEADGVSFQTHNLMFWYKQLSFCLFVNYGHSLAFFVAFLCLSKDRLLSDKKIRYCNIVIIFLIGILIVIGCVSLLESMTMYHWNTLL